MNGRDREADPIDLAQGRFSTALLSARDACILGSSERYWGNRFMVFRRLHSVPAAS